MTDHRLEENTTRIAHEIETRLHHGDETKSTLHDELHKLQKLDTHHGHLNAPQFKHDIHTVENKLHKDGYLPHLHISVDHNSHIKLEHIKNHAAKGKTEHAAGSNEDSKSGHNKPRIEAPNSDHNKPRIDDPNSVHNKPRIEGPRSGQNKLPIEDPNSGRNPLQNGDRPGFGQQPIPFRAPIAGRDPAFNRDAPYLDPNSGRDRTPYSIQDQDSRRDRIPYPQQDPNYGPDRIPYPPQDRNSGRDRIPYSPPPDLKDSIPYSRPQDLNSGRDRIPYPQRDPNFGQDHIPSPQQDPNYGQDRIPSPPQDLSSGRDRIPYPNPNRDDFRGSNPLRDQGLEQNGDRPAPFDRSDDQNKFDGQFRELRLDNRSANHPGADAMVYVRKDFDPSKPVHLVVYNHGFESTVSNALGRDKVKEMMSHAQANTVLMLPEWQASPGSRSGNSGTFQQQDKFTNMVQEMMQKTPALHGVGLRNVDRIDIIAHSAGYSPTEAEINKNPAISNKVHSITLLDSLYSRHAFDQWLGDNINDLSSGRKQFYNFSNTTTSLNSKAQAQMVGIMLRKNGLPTNNYVADYGTSSGEVARHGSEMAGRSIVFASTTVRHGDIPGKYIGPTLTALNPERYQTPQV
jgi:hypothetical protein